MNEFMTSDLQLASYLAAVGHELLRIEGSPGRRCFVFAGDVSADVASYYRGTRPIAPQLLFRSYRRLKSFLFQPA